MRKRITSAIKHTLTSRLFHYIYVNNVEQFVDNTFIQVQTLFICRKFNFVRLELIIVVFCYRDVCKLTFKYTLEETSLLH